MLYLKKVCHSPVWPSHLVSGLCAVAYVSGAVTSLCLCLGLRLFPFCLTSATALCESGAWLLRMCACAPVCIARCVLHVVGLADVA